MTSVQPERLQGGWKYLLALYLVSFALPVDDGWGVGAFVVSLLWGYRSPVVWLFWAANPLFWFGLYSLRKGRYAAAAVLGCAAGTCASLPLPMMIWQSVVSDPSNLPKFAGYFAWFASTAGLATVGLVARFQPRKQIHVRSLMIVVSAVALAPASLPTLVRLLGAPLVLPGK